MLPAVALAGLLVGAVTTTAALDTAQEVEVPGVDERSANASEGQVAAADDDVLLLWASGGVPPEVAAALRAHPGVEAVTEVRVGPVELLAARDAAGAVVESAPAGMVVPLEAMAFDPRTYRRFVPPSASKLFATLGAGQVLLGETSARLRRAGPGARLELAGSPTLSVAGVVDDGLVGAAELAVPLPLGEELGITEVRYLLVAHRGERAAIEAAARAGAPGRALRARSRAETPYLRHGDAVLPQVMVKERFGEFAYRLGSGPALDLDPAWERENVVTTEVPLLGRVRCHRSLIAPLGAAMAELRDRNLAYLVDPGGFAGCWNPRHIGPDASSGISRHAWGIAVDLNVSKNPTGLASVQDPRLVAVMERWGFTWGGRWLVLDPAHFEYLRPPAAAASSSG